MATRTHQQIDRLKDTLIAGPLLIVSPSFLITSYLWLADHWFRWNMLTDITALVVSLLVGGIGILLLPNFPVARGISAIGYVVLMGWLMAIWAIVWRGGL